LGQQRPDTGEGGAALRIFQWHKEQKSGAGGVHEVTINEGVKMQEEKVGMVYAKTDSDAIKARLKVMGDIRDNLDLIDMTDNNHWVINVTQDMATLLCSSHMLPQAAYSLTKILLGIKEMSDGGNPVLAGQTHAAIIQATEDHEAGKGCYSYKEVEKHING
jgi:hypothetical protein